MNVERKIHILVVDKDYNNREYVRRALDDIGVDCTTCASNNEAVTSFRVRDYDGVILDGDHDDYSSFITAAQACDKTDVPIVLFSGSSRVGRYKQLWEQGYYVLQNNDGLPNTLKAFIELTQDRKRRAATQTREDQHVRFGIT